MLTERAMAVLDFRKRMRVWRELVAQHADSAGCAETKCRYHEVHLYCAADDVLERRRLKALFEELGLWLGRFRFTHERQGALLAAVDPRDAREEIMLGTHFLLPSPLVPAMTHELIAVARGIGIEVLRVRVERPLGRSTARLHASNARSWWEAHISVSGTTGAVFIAARDLDIRDVSQRLDFVDGSGTAQVFANVEAQGDQAHVFAAQCDALVARFRAAGLHDITVGLEEVLLDWPVGSGHEPPISHNAFRAACPDAISTC